MKTALVHDWMNQVGGAEDVLEALVDSYPSRPIYTSLYAPDRMPAHWRSWDIHTSFIDRLPLSHQKQQLYFPLYPLAFERFSFEEYDLVISNKSGFCHGIKTPASTLHICYCLTPTRYVWRFRQYAERENLGLAIRAILPPFLKALRRWDRNAADRVDYFIAISEEVRQRIARIYKRDSVIIYPPVDTSRFVPVSEPDDYYLFVGRLVPYRRVDLLIEAFNEMPERHLWIAGAGRDRDRLESLAGANISFLGYVPDEQLPELLAKCRAFVFPGEEDFGIAPIQAMASGRPVIAYGAGGARETVVPGTGILFAQQSVTAIIEAMNAFDADAVSPQFIVSYARKFDRIEFERKLSTFIADKIAERRQIDARVPE